MMNINKLRIAMDALIVSDLPDDLMDECRDAIRQAADLLAEVEELRKDRERLDILRRNVSPAQLVENGLPDFGNLQADEPTEDRINRMVDAAIDKARKG